MTPYRPRIGLALGSGVARGWAHIGVLHALKRAGIRPDIVVGTSIGALVGGVYLANKLDVLEEWARSLNKRSLWRYLDVRLSGGGLIGGSRLNAILDANLGGIQVKSLDRRFAAVATDLGSGHEVWLREGPLALALRASYALPGVFSPIKHDGGWLVDGALVNPVPVSVCRALGARLVIAVNLNADIFGRSRAQNPTRVAEAELLDGPAGGGFMGALNPQRLLARKLFGRDDGAPSLFTVMVDSLSIIQDRVTRSRLAGDPPDVTIAPRLGDVGLLDFDKAAQMIEEGEAATERSLPFLREAMSVLGMRFAEESAPPDENRVVNWDNATD